MIPAEKSGLILAGAITILLGALAVVGIDYSETRARSQEMPNVKYRVTVIESTLRESSQEQASAVRELSQAVIRLEQTIIRLEERTKP